MLLIYNKKEKLVRKKNEYKWKNINNIITKKKKREKFIQYTYQGIEILPLFNLIWLKPNFYIDFYCKKLINIKLILIKILIILLNFKLN